MKYNKVASEHKHQRACKHNDDSMTCLQPRTLLLEQTRRLTLGLIKAHNSYCHYVGAQTE